MEDQELLRYSKQIMLPQVDVEGQQKIMDSTILIIGMGGCLLYTSDAADE